MIKIFVLLSFAVLAFFTAPSTPAMTRAAPRACQANISSDSARVVRHARELVSEVGLAWARTEFAIPSISPDSVEFYAVVTACDSAAVSYQAYRIANGGSANLIPVTLVRLGNTGKFFGTSFLPVAGDYRKYLIFNSTFQVVSTIDLNN